MRTGHWRQLLQHDGYVVARLRVFTPNEGGQDRHVQSGMRAMWAADGLAQPLDGGLEIPDDIPSIGPGREATVHIRPMEPSAWANVQPGMRLGMCKNWPRELGEALIVERVNVPITFTPLRVRSSPIGAPAVAMLRRRRTWRERLRGLLTP